MGSAAGRDSILLSQNRASLCNLVGAAVIATQGKSQRVGWQYARAEHRGAGRVPFALDSLLPRRAAARASSLAAAEPSAARPQSRMEFFELFGEILEKAGGALGSALVSATIVARDPDCPQPCWSDLSLRISRLLGGLASSPDHLPDELLRRVRGSAPLRRPQLCWEWTLWHQSESGIQLQ